MHFSGFNDTTGIADNDLVKYLSCKPDTLFIFTHSGTMMAICTGTKAHALLHCHLSPNTTLPASEHLNRSKFHHCGGTHYLGHSDLNEMCELWVTVTGHLQVIVTLA